MARCERYRIGIRKKALAAAAGVGLLTMLLPLTAHAADEGPNAVALTGSGTRLGRFNVDRPAALTPIGGAITGLTGDNNLVGIDRRVQKMVGPTASATPVASTSCRARRPARSDI